MRLIIIISLAALCSCENTKNVTDMHNGLSERIGNFSIELLYHASKAQNGQNMIISPITLWTALAVISEGAIRTTRQQINYALRISSTTRKDMRNNFRDIAQWLRVNTSTVELAKLNAIFVDSKNLPLQDFQDIAKTNYETDVIKLNFSDAVLAADTLNDRISNVTHGRLPNVVHKSNFMDSQMILVSALYFHGQWTVPFKASATAKLPFHDSNGKKIGEVNMMYNRHTYPFANIRELQARVIELPYGKENRLSMFIMLPNPGVSLENMFFNFKNITLDKLFTELKLSMEEYSDDEVDCFIPRFKITTDMDVTNILKEAMGIQDLFDEKKAQLPFLARTPLHVSKVIHKAEIDVTEDGTTASGVTVAEFSNRMGAVRFEANKPFTYIIVEKVTNSIVFGGIYENPSLY